MAFDELLSRRTFLRKFASVGLLGLGASTLTACASGSSEEQADGSSGAEGASAAEDPCSDLSELSEGQIETRKAVAYVKETPDPDTRCDNCKFWLPPREDEPCGECVAVPGPIHPEGYCNSWAPMTDA
jgi:hypothetical protein